VHLIPMRWSRRREMDSNPRSPARDRRNLSGQACVQLTTMVQEVDHGLSARPD
jgi:hypothetical protein